MNHFLRNTLFSGVILTNLFACSSEQWNSPYVAGEENASILYSSFRERPKHLDPAKSYSSNEYAFIAQIYEPPFQYHYLNRPYELVPATAVSMPEVTWTNQAGEPLESQEGAAYTEYTITIKPDIQYQPHPALAQGEEGYLYHDVTEEDLTGIYTLSDFEGKGTRELLAADYVYQIKRLADPRLHSPVAGLFSNYIVGFKEFTDEVKQLTEDKSTTVNLRDMNMEGVSVEGKYAYKVRLKGVYPQFVYWMTLPFFSPMPWEADLFYSQAGMDERNINLNWYPIGTGAYMLTENNPNLRMVLEENPNFHGETYPSEGPEEDRKNGLLEDAGKALPFIKKAVYSLEKESIPYWNKFLQGYYDNSGVSSDSFDQAIQFNGGELNLTPEMTDKGIALATAVNSSVFYMGFNMRDDVIGGLSDRAIKLRRAISIAMDYEEYISIFLNGRGSPAQGILPPGIFGYEEGEQGINPYLYEWDNKPVRKSLDVAKQLMVEAGYPNGRDKETGKQLILNLDSIGAGPDAKANLQWIIKQYEKLGIKLVVRNTDYNRFQEKMMKGTAQIFQWGWNADYPDPENFYFLLYGPNNKVDNHGENAANYESAEFDALFEQMKDMPNSPARLAIIKKMDDIIRHDAPWVFGINPKSFTLYHDWYRNAKPNLMANNTLKYKGIDPELRAKKRSDWNQPIVWPVILLVIVLFISMIPAYRHYRQSEQGGAL